MGKNIVEDDRGTIFLDFDGTCVYHGYDPEHEEDRFIPEALEWIKDMYIKGYRIIVVTARRKEHCKNIGLLFGRQGIGLTGLIYGLGTGPRILVNDHQRGGKDKAIALNPISELWNLE